MNFFWPISIIVSFSFVCVFPAFYTFVGTDIGVYYEISRVLFEEGSLVLFGNYWDHKPILIYLWFYPFHYLDSFIPFSSLGLRIGSWLLYCLTSILIYFGLYNLFCMSRVSYSKWNIWFCLIPALFYCSLSFSSFDYAHNNILTMASFGISLAGLIFAIIYLGSEYNNYLIGTFSGFLLASAPFFRPTGIAGIVTCLALLIFLLLFYRRKYMSLITRSGSLVLITICFFLMWLLITHFLGSSWQNIFCSIVLFNKNYAGISNYTVSTFEFLTFDKNFIKESAILLLLILISCHRLLEDNKKKEIKKWWILGLLIFWGIVEIGISISLQRKTIGYYLITPLFSLFFIAFSLLFSGNPFKSILNKIMLFVLVVLIVFHPIQNLIDIPSAVYFNTFASQKEMPTAEVVRLIKQESRSSSPRVFIFGNRSNLYSLAAFNDIKSFSWVTYANVLTVEDFSQVFKDKLDGFRYSIINDPPEFIVFTGQLNHSNVIPNIFYRVEDEQDLEWLELWIKGKYVEVKTLSSDINSWPYNYTYKVYRLIDNHK